MTQPLCQQCQDATLEALDAMGGSATRAEIRRWAFDHAEIDHKAPRGHIEHHLWWSLGWLRKQGEVVPGRYGRWRRARTASAGTAPSRTMVHEPSAS